MEIGLGLGLQLLFDRGYEHGEYDGLGILSGDVVRFDVPTHLKVPHMGWNTVTRQNEPPILADIPDDTHFYFVHSYFVRPADPSVVALTCNYGGEFCAMVWRDNLYATQFHPEKSQDDGLKLLRAFNNLPTTTETLA